MAWPVSWSWATKGAEKHWLGIKLWCGMKPTGTMIALIWLHVCEPPVQRLLGPY